MRRRLVQPPVSYCPHRFAVCFSKLATGDVSCPLEGQHLRLHDEYTPAPSPPVLTCRSQLGFARETCWRWSREQSELFLGLFLGLVCRNAIFHGHAFKATSRLLARLSDSTPRRACRYAPGPDTRPMGGMVLCYLRPTRCCAAGGGCSLHGRVTHSGEPIT